MSCKGLWLEIFSSAMQPHALHPEGYVRICPLKPDGKADWLRMPARSKTPYVVSLGASRIVHKKALNNKETISELISCLEGKEYAAQAKVTLLYHSHAYTLVSFILVKVFSSQSPSWCLARQVNNCVIPPCG
ncbi:hypothetical protein QOT17_016175 [Balamuthia mandrillaris]